MDARALCEMLPHREPLSFYPKVTILSASFSEAVSHVPIGLMTKPKMPSLS